MKTTKKNLLVMLISIAVLTGCKKEEGPAGPAGKDGNANVSSSTTVTLNNWISDYDNGTEYQYSNTVTWANITQSIKDKGAVLIYMQNGSEWVAVPYSYAGTDYSFAYNFYVNTGSVKIEFTGYDSGFGSPGTSSQNGLVVRIIAIASNSMVKLQENRIDVRNYKEVIRHL